MSGYVLAGDLGGTNARFAIFEESGRRALHSESLESRSFLSFEDALARFLANAPSRLASRGRLRFAAASFGIAGPVVDQRVRTTNLPWVIDAKTVAKTFGIPRVTLLNDLVVAGITAIGAPPRKLHVLRGGRPKPKGANVAVIAAGTGLGEATFIWGGTEHVPCATEGGHVDFAARTAVEVEYAAALSAEYGHVSYERVAAGSTIKKLYRFLVRETGVKESKQNAAIINGASDPNVAIVDLAVKGTSEAAMRTLDLWCSIYGAEAGNLALKCFATGGVFLAGGLSGRLASVLEKGLPARKGPSPFLEAFLDKGRMRPLLEKVSVAVLLEPQAGLLGAAAHASRAARIRAR